MRPLARRRWLAAGPPLTRAVLDRAHLSYSHKHHTLVSLTAPEAADPSEWHLPTYDPRGEAKYHYKLHSLDVYFHTQADALQFVSGVRRVLPPAQADVRDEPRDASGLVQQLEKVALSGPSAAEQARDFTPMAYNPAAPAAPESIRPREKTPPPEDGGVNPLATAMAYDQQPFSPGMPPPPPPPPGAGPGAPGQVASPGMPPQGFGTHPGLQRSSTMPVHAGLASPGLNSPYAPSFQAPQGYAPQAAPQAAPQHGTPPAGAQVPPPPGGPQYGHGGQQGYAVHQQFYTPGEGEQAALRQGNRLEENAGRLERGVGGMFKKFEKRFG